jgi:diguanylate cyclase (GGDEF)-like protein
MSNRTQTYQGRAVVIDDDPNIRLLASKTLEDMGFVVATGANGVSGLQTAKRELPDLILCDVMMPDIDGFAVCEQVRADDALARVPIVMMTSLEDLTSIDRAYQTGATDFVIKPVNWSLLRHRIRYIMRATNAMADLTNSQASLADAQRMARLGSWRWDTAESQVALSDEMRRIYGLAETVATLSTADFTRLIDESDVDYVQRVRNSAVTEERPYSIEYMVRQPGAAERHVRERAEPRPRRSGNGVDFAGTVLDITEHKRRQDQINFMTYHDPLTGLGNRRQVQLHLDRLGNDTRAALLHLDLDNFHRLNDAVGPAAADQFLAHVANAFSELVRLRHSDIEVTLARLDADEFAVVMGEVESAADAIQLAETLRDRCAQVAIPDHEDFSVTASVGVAVFPIDGDTSDRIMRAAAAAVRLAKAGGRGSVAKYEASAMSNSQEELSIESLLVNAVNNNELTLNYQPLWDLHEQRIGKVEALVRWNSPRLGMISPAQFIPIAEQTGLIGEIGAWVLRRACEDACTWTAPEGPAPKVAVNLSAWQLRQPELLAEIRDTLRATGLPPSRLDLELTEGMLIEARDAVATFLEGARDHGMSTSLDDFGTGYSSLAYLTSLPVDALKIDRSFVTPLPDAEEAAAIARAIIGLSRTLGLTVVAEGIEDAAQFNFLRDEGCDLIQGYAISRPLEAVDIAAMIAAPPTEIELGLRCLPCAS